MAKYRKYRGRGSQRKAGLIAAAVVLLAVVGFGVYIMVAQDYLPNDTMNVSAQPDIISPSPTLVYEQDTSTDAPDDTEAPITDSVIIERPERITAIYLPDVNDTQARNGALQLASGGKINTVVLNVKDDDGKLAFISQSQFAIDAPANPETSDLSAFVEELHDAGIYVMARMAVFEENLVSNAFRDMSVATQNGTRWLDWRYHGWLNPYNADAQEYIKTLAAEVCGLGFDEILLDNLRFPTRGRPELLYYKDEADGISREVALSAFARELEMLLDDNGVVMNLAYDSELVSLVAVTSPTNASGITAELLSVGHITVDTAVGETSLQIAPSLSSHKRNVLARVTLQTPYNTEGAAEEIATVLETLQDCDGVILVSEDGMYAAG